MSQTIPNQAPTVVGQNFQLLRDEGQAIIARLAGEQWSDHNLHDPGITMLEAAAFTLNDLSYRLDFPITDLMAQPEGERPLQPWWQPEQALACEPVTASDLRRLLLDYDHVHNVDVQPDVDNPALWRISVVADAGLENSPAARQALASGLHQHYLQHRNLGEDIAGLTILPPRPLALRLALTLADGADTADTLTDLLVRLADTLSPGVDFKSCQQMADEGADNDALCSGPWLTRGFITDEQLARPMLRTKLYLSDLISEVAQDSRIKAIEQLQLSTNPDTPDGWQSWQLSLTGDEAPLLDLDGSLANIRVVKEGIPVEVPAARIRQLYQARLQPGSSPGRPGMLSELGRYRQPGQYLSLQHELPSSYGVGRDGLAASASADEVAQVQQLQGWLMLLDQPLANQFAQLDQARHLLSLPDAEALLPLQALLDRMLASLPLTDADISLFWRALDQLPPSHCSQPVAGLHSLEAILGEQLDDYQGQALQHLSEKPFSARQLDRGDRLLQHLLARHHEQVPDRAMLRYEEQFRHYSGRLLAHPDASDSHSEDDLTVAVASLKNLLDRAAFILDLPATGGGRGLGGNYLARPVRTDDAISGLRHRLYRRLGLGRVAMNSLATHNGEGFHLVEGVLLRHAEAGQAHADDVYILIPRWPSRFANPDFAQLFVDTLHAEMPMHLQPKLIWLERSAMADFEQLHNGWLNALSVQPQYGSADSDPCDARQARLQQLSTTLDNFIHLAAAGTPPAVDYDAIRLPTLGEHSSENIPVQCFTVGYSPVPTLSYDPDTNDDGVIGKVRINPQDSHVDPFIVRIRPPYPTRD